jgi:hypothetical protein
VASRRLCAIFEAPAVVAGLDDVAVVGQPVEHGGCLLGVAEHLRPVGEGQIGGDQQRGAFIEFADQVKQQLAARLAERQIPEGLRQTFRAFAASAGSVSKASRARSAKADAPLDSPLGGRCPTFTEG